jgi:hypothetical protein
VVAIAGVLSVSAAAAPTTVAPAQVIAKFKASTGVKLLVDTRANYPGHYTALGVAQSISNIGRFGKFTIFVVTSGQEEDVTRLLADVHTGVPGAPGPSMIYWQSGSTIGGDQYWLAKKRYANLVLWWYGTAKKIDPAFKRLHRALLAMTTGP